MNSLSEVFIADNACVTYSIGYRDVRSPAFEQLRTRVLCASCLRVFQVLALPTKYSRPSVDEAQQPMYEYSGSWFVFK
jgi:hypothetical protein